MAVEEVEEYWDRFNDYGLNESDKKVLRDMWKLVNEKTTKSVMKSAFPPMTVKKAVKKKVVKKSLKKPLMVSGYKIGDTVRCLPGQKNAGAGYEAGLVFKVTEIVEKTPKTPWLDSSILFGAVDGMGVYSKAVERYQGVEVNEPIASPKGLLKAIQNFNKYFDV